MFSKIQNINLFKEDIVLLHAIKSFNRNKKKPSLFFNFDFLLLWSKSQKIN